MGRDVVGQVGSGFSELLGRARRGEREAIASLYQTYSARVAAIVRRRMPRILRPKYDTMDLAHSVFAELLRDLPRIEDRGEGAFVRLLAIKAECKIRQKLRRHLGHAGQRAEARFATSRESELPAAGAGEGAALDVVDEEIKLRRLIGEFGPQERALLRLHGEGRTFAEIAPALGLPSAEAARKRHARLLAELRGRWRSAPGR